MTAPRCQVCGDEGTLPCPDPMGIAPSRVPCPFCPRQVFNDPAQLSILDDDAGRDASPARGRGDAQGVA